jgi:general secretion pathway protein D
MIDVLLAEVTLNDKEGLGVDWSNVNTDLGSKNLVMNTSNVCPDDYLTRLS